jgi:branched-chain amino acid transport system permease protein
MVALALGVNRLVLRPLVGSPVIALLMVTIGLGIVLRASAVFLFQGLPAGLPLPIPRDPVAIQGVLLSIDELVAAGIALLCVAAVSWGLQHSRIGLAIRAMADDQQAAMLVGIDLPRYVAMTWALMGVLCVVAGTLWTFMSGGGIGVVLVGLKVLPMVIIGGLDSLPGTLLGALVVGLLESLAAGYLDPLVGGGISTIVAYLVALVVLWLRPYGLLGTPDIERV